MDNQLQLSLVFLYHAGPVGGTDNKPRFVSPSIQSLIYLKNGRMHTHTSQTLACFWRQPASSYDLWK